MEMTIAVVGLGLMGGSLCKALKAYTSHTVLGLDIDPSAMDKAKSAGAIDRQITPPELSSADIVFICLTPENTLKFIIDNISCFKKGAIVADICGVKSEIVRQVEAPLLQKGVFYVGTHPMAGREYSGFAHSDSGLFKGASFIVIKTANTSMEAAGTISELALAIGFGSVVSSTPEEHDRIIAYTSQLAHIVSNAYIKSPTLSLERGFSAGSFKDMTRVARLDERMWSSLFLLNRDPLLFEIETIISNLNQYKAALETGDRALLERLLKEGRVLKERND
jgi:prephenate dehydrogenase